MTDIPSFVAQLAERWPLLLPLLAAHLLGDFTLQPRSWLAAKKAKLISGQLLLHSLIPAALSYLFAAAWSAWWMIPVLALTHLAIDAGKSRLGDGQGPFLGDQLLHLAVIVAVALRVDPQSASPWMGMKAWSTIIAFLLVWEFAGVLLSIATRRWRRELGDLTGLDSAGLWIGRLERSLILLFVLSGHPEGVGFLVAAKSIFRFSPSGDGPGDARKEAEYFLVGTLGSFAFALVVAYGLKACWAAF